MRVPFPPARITPRMAMSCPLGEPRPRGRGCRSVRTSALAGGVRLRQLPVLLLVVAQVVLVLDRGDPVGVRPVPRDRLSEPPVERGGRPPAEFPLGLRAVDRVAPVVPRPVL